jgi:hypothetical protein
MNGRIAFCFSVSIFSITHSNSQKLGSIEGKAFDAKTREPLFGATVYLANTAIGAVTNADGSFTLNGIHPGKYNLTASMIGYKLFSKPVFLDGNSISGQTILLEPRVEELKSVEVIAKRSNNRIDFSEFRRTFLGETQNSYRCKIINIHDIFVYRDRTKLYAVAHKPIEIVNSALGYRIFYELIDFTLDYFDNTVTLVGIPRFENLVPEKDKQAKRWVKERDRAYYGSEYHFFRSLKKRELKKNHFTIYDSNNTEISENSLLKTGNDSTVCFKGDLRAVFDGEAAEFFFPIRSRWQNSIMKFSGNPITIYSNGYYQDYRDVILTGYFGWSNRIAEILPLGYQPTSKIR